MAQKHDSMHMHDHHNMHHQNHMGHHHHGDFKKKFLISLIFALPIIILSPMMGLHLPFHLKVLIG